MVGHIGVRRKVKENLLSLYAQLNNILRWETGCRFDESTQAFCIEIDKFERIQNMCVCVCVCVCLW